MIERYSLPAMRRIWSEDHKFQTWLDVEIAVCEAQAKLGVIPMEAVDEIIKKAAFDTARISEIEAEVQHDVIAFLTNLAESIGPAAKYVHYGLTSYDVLDTALSLRLRDAADILIAGAERLSGALKKRAKEFKKTVMVGRTHGVHAEPTTFGLKLLIWHLEMERNVERLKRAREVISYGKISGAVGTYANIDPTVESQVCVKLGLKPAPASDQVLQRDRHAEYVGQLAVTAASLEKFATDLRNLQRTEIREVEEPFGKGQKGSSAMPHKKNPVICERICGLARIVRANASAALENVALWDERDISHSSVERIILPDSTGLLDYMLDRATYVIEGLTVYPDNMKRNLEKTNGLIYSQRVLLALVEKGLSREDTYRIVQRNAMKVWAGAGTLADELKADPDVTKHLSAEEIDCLFEADYYLRHIDQIFSRAGVK